MRDQTIGQWLVLDRDPVIDHAGYARWHCRCACGQERLVAGYALRRGRSRSCSSCWRRTHGESKEPLYAIWQSMRERCNNPLDKRYADYGGRGIQVHPAWDVPTGWPLFRDHVGVKPGGPRGSPDHHSLDRINGDDDYRPGNVRWATPLEQARHRRPPKPRQPARLAA
jgi:hypothetical protein